MVVVETLVEVRLAVAVEVVQDHDLIAAADVDLVLDDLQAERLEQARRDALPGQPLGRGVDARRPATRRRPRCRRRRGGRRRRKSKPVSRIWQFHGLFAGCVSTSMANACASAPTMACVFSTSGQRRGPPCVNGSSDGGRRRVSAKAPQCIAVAVGQQEFDVTRRRRRGDAQEREAVLFVQRRPASPTRATAVAGRERRASAGRAGICRRSACACRRPFRRAPVRRRAFPGSSPSPTV